MLEAFSIFVSGLREKQIVNVGEKRNFLSNFVTIEKPSQKCINENNHSLFIN